MRLTRRMFVLPLLLCLTLFSAAAPVNASSVFDGTNADLWLIDEDEGRIAGYDFNTWLTQFAPGGIALYPLGGGEQAIINVLQNSSIPLSPNQPTISIVGIEPGLDGANPDGHPKLLVLPGDGPYDETIPVQMMVNTAELSLDPVQLRWTVNAEPQQQISISKDARGRSGTVEQGGYVIKTIHLARDGDHRVLVELYQPDRSPPFTLRQIGAESRRYSLASSHPDGEARDTDGDGIPDVVEAEIGLDPNDEDWQKDSDGDGWSDFDEWLRTTCLDASLQPIPGSDCSDSAGNPGDTDGDGWADFDEQIRGTNHLDEAINPALLLEGEETPTSASLLKRIRSYKDYPVARRLYEVERLVAGNLPGPTQELLNADSVVAMSVSGEKTYDSNQLLSGDDLSRVGFDGTDVPPRMQASVAAAELAAARLPNMRLPAGTGGVINATYRSTEIDSQYRRIYKLWLQQRTDLSPQDFLAQTGPQEYLDAEAWRSAFVAYLVANAVVQDAGLIVDLGSTRSVSLFEAALSRESRLNGLQGTQILSPRLGAIDPNLVQAVQDGLNRIAADDYSFDNVIAGFDAASQAGQPLESVAQWIDTIFQSGDGGSRSDAYIASRFVGSADFDYLVRLVQLPGALAALAGDATLADRLADSDGDSAGNGAELNLPLTQVTLPWLADSDGDSILDGSDECPIDPFNGCSSNPILPEITVGFDVVVSEPEAGSNIAIVSIILDRIVDFDVTINFTAFVAPGDTAEGGTDFTEVSGTVTIPAGERVALISVPILADASTESPETFTIQITGVSGATLGDDGVVVVTINNTVPGANTAPVFTSASSIDVVEGGFPDFYTATASDADNDTLTYTIVGGADSALLDIETDTGLLFFRGLTIPDLDPPGDANGDNDYEVQLQVADGRGGLDTLDLVVTVVRSTLQIQMTYPTPNANLGGGVTMTTVRGRIIDPVGDPIDPADIVALDVNLNAATLDPVNVGLWSVEVPVSEGLNTLDISMEMADGTVSQVSYELQNRAVHGGFGDSEPDFANNRLLVIDGWVNGLLTVDLATGDRTVLSAAGIVGSGATFSSPRGVVLDSANNRALVVDYSRDALIAVDLASGDRTDISSNSVGTGVALDGPNAIAFDPANNRVFVPATIDDIIVAVDLATGDRTTISGPGVGAGPDFGSGQGIVYDDANNRVLVSDSFLDAIIAVDIASGDRTIISDDTVGSGPTISPLDMTLDSGNNRVLAADQVNGLFAVDLATGDRTVLSNPAADYGRNASRIQSVVLDTVTNIAYVPDSTVDVIFAMDLTAGTYTVFSDSFVGDGSPETGMWVMRGLAIDASRNRLLMYNGDTRVLLDVDLNNANRAVVSGSNVGNGPLPTFPGRLDVDDANDRALVTDGNIYALIATDLATGDRSILSDNTTVGTGPLFEFPADTEVDPANNRAFVLDSQSGLLRVDLLTGDRSVVSDAVTGSGPAFGFADGLDIDFANNTGYVVDDGGTAVIAVDIVTGDREVLSDNAGAGVGPSISFPNDIQLDVANNRALIINRGGGVTTRNLMAIDLASGDRTIISGSGIGSGVQLLGPWLIQLDAENNRAFIYDLIVTGVIVVDLATGERALASK